MLYHELLKQFLLETIQSIFIENKIEEIPSDSLFNIEIPNNQKFGDVSTNIAMIFSKKLHSSPLVLAEKIQSKLEKSNMINKIEVVTPGFLNIFFKDGFWQDQLKILASKTNKYSYKIKKKKICLEFVSANPTGLMHIGHARGAVLGDTIASILSEVGHDVHREYYINDAGEQIKKLEDTIVFHLKNKDDCENMSDELYPGEYLKNISKFIKVSDFKSMTSNFLKKKIVSLVMKDIKNDLKNLKVKHHKFISEKKICSRKNISNVISALEKQSLCYYGVQDKPKSFSGNDWKQKKQLLFKSKKLGDDSDRALLKPNGEQTYFMSDIIYHQDKIERNFDTLINIWGVDHSGYVKRLKNAIKELNKDKSFCFEIKFTSLVNLLNDQKVVKMSKRDGNYITLRQVINEVGVDVVRFMMISRVGDKKIDFDFNLVKSKTKDNPVFYVQYAFARCKSLHKTYDKVFKKKIDLNEIKNVDLSNLRLVEEKILIKKLCNFFNVIISAANFYEPHRLTNYLYDLAKDFHSYWGLGRINESKKIISDNEELSRSRIFLVIILGIIIKKGMNILNINCPENM